MPSNISDDDIDAVLQKTFAELVQKEQLPPEPARLEKGVRRFLETIRKERGPDSHWVDESRGERGHGR